MNGDCLVFHDIERATSTFIHLTPALVSYTMRWLIPESVGLFELNDETSNTSLHLTEHLFVNPCKIYLCWFIPYAIWLICFGCTMPDNGWGRSSFKDMQPFFIKKWGVTNIYGQCMCYLIGHAITNALVVGLIPRFLF